MTDLENSLETRRKELEAELEKVNKLLAVVRDEDVVEEERIEPVAKLMPAKRRARRSRESGASERIASDIQSLVEQGKPFYKSQVEGATTTVTNVLQSFIENGQLTMSQEKMGNGAPRNVYVPKVQGEEATATRPKAQRRSEVRLHVGTTGPRDAEIQRHVRGDVDVRRCTSE